MEREVITPRQFTTRINKIIKEYGSDYEAVKCDAEDLIYEILKSLGNEAVEKIKKDETCHEEYRIESIVLVAETGNNTHNILIL